MIETIEQKNFTIKKKQFSFASGRNVDRVFRFYTKAGKNFFYPPINNFTKDRKFKNIPGIKKRPLTESEKILFQKNIMIQEMVMDIIKYRDEKFNYFGGLVMMKTGQGKSHIIMSITEHYSAPTLILVHNIKTLQEMERNFKEFMGIQISVYGNGRKEIGDTTVMTKTSLSLAYEEIIDKFDVILIDEAPVKFSRDFWDSINIICQNKVKALYGFSGTPYRDILDCEDLQRYFGKIIDTGIGYDIIPKFHFIDYHFPKNTFFEYENNHQLRDMIQEYEHRKKSQNNFILEHIPSFAGLVLSDRKEELENLYQTFKIIECDKIIVFKMTGDTKVKDDEENIKKAREVVKKGGYAMIFGTIQKCGIGVDISFISEVFLMSCIKFKATVIQAIGRALRGFEGKSKVNVYVWNDSPFYASQRREKMKAINEEYGIEKDFINFTTIKYE